MLHCQNVLSYDVVSCTECGALYADNVPSQVELSDYYGDSSHHLHLELPAALELIHQEFFTFIRDRLEIPSNAAILDIGCGMGHFLNLFRKAGFENLLGVEPSRQAVHLAKFHYGIRVENQPFEKIVFSQNFSLVSACGVLEHVAEVNAFVKQVRLNVSDSGAVFIAVPDAGAFDKPTLREPFLEFAAEHINFFTADSLARLFSANGFEVVDIESRYNNFYNNYYLCAIFRPAHSIQPVSKIRELAGRESLLRYIEQSNACFDKLKARIDQLRSDRMPVIVWGAGSFSRRLCATSSLSEALLIGFVDKNPQLHGLHLLDRSIHPPEWLEQIDRNFAVIIASTTYADEIEVQLRTSYGWRGPIVRLNC